MHVILPSNFYDDCCSSLENKNTLAIEIRKHFTEAANQRCSLNFCLAAIIKIIQKRSVKESIFQKS